MPLHILGGLIMIDIKKKRLYLYLDNESMTGYVGETQRGLLRHNEHKKSVKFDRAALVKKVGKPVTIKTDFNKLKAVWFAEHAAYLMYKEKGYDMLQDPPHPNIFAKYKDRVDDCKICDELGCDFTKERLEYILAVHRVSKLCDYCKKPFYYDPTKHRHINNFNNIKCCSHTCGNNKKWQDPDIRLKASKSKKGANNPNFDKPTWNKGKKCPQLASENNSAAKITKVAAICIKILLKYTTLTHREIADIIPNATKAIVDQISRGKSWKDISIHDFINS
jgi:hypothetical protein